MAYSGVFVFGDSLVDSGNALKLAEWYDGLPLQDLPEGAPTEEDGYFEGRFSNGYTFADLVANKVIGVVTKPIFPYHFEDPWIGLPIAPFASDPNGNNLNFAYGGAHIRQGDEVVPDLDQQTDAFRDAVDGDAPPGALYLVTAGGNDIRDLAPTGSDPVPQADAHAELQRCADELFEELAQLVDHGAHHIVITGIPNVGLIPRYDRDGDGVLSPTEQLRSDAATDYSVYLDTLIRTEVVPALEALGADVTYVPLMDYVDAGGNLVQGALSANLPTIAALHGLTTEELTNNLLQYKELIFFDHVHPNAQANALLGAYMQAMIGGTPWIETLPLTSTEVDYSLTASIAVAGEVDQLVIAMVAGTSYTFDLLGVSSLGTTGSLADPMLRLLNPAGTLVESDDDSGAGFDSTITFGAAGSGNHVLQLLAVGSVTGSYTLQAAVVSGAATLIGNSYVINSAATLVLEGAGGIGEDVVRTSVSYALSAGSEIEVLRTTNDKGKSAINLTGNEYGQTLVGNAGANILDGKGGADTLVGRGGKDVFVLGRDALTSPESIDRISDYARGEIVDITQVLSVAAGTNVSAGGYLRVTTSGLVQVDLSGGDNEWVTLSSVSGSGAVTFRYLSGGSATTVALSRTAASQQLSLSASSSNGVLAGAVAAAGLVAFVPSGHPSSDVQDLAFGTPIAAAVDSIATDPTSMIGGSQLTATPGTADAAVSHLPSAFPRPSLSEADSIAMFDGAPVRDVAFPEIVELPGQFGLSAGPLPVARPVAMPSAEELGLALEVGLAGQAGDLGDIASIIADALDVPAAQSALLDRMLAALVAADPLEGPLVAGDAPGGWDLAGSALLWRAPVVSPFGDLGFHQHQLS